MVRRRCAWAAALGLLRCMPFIVGGPLQGSSHDTRHSLAVAKMFVFFSSCKAVCSIACSVLPSLHDALDVCFSQNFRVQNLGAPLNDASRWSICKKKKAENSTFGGSTFTVGGRSFPCPEVHFACRCAAMSFASRVVCTAHSTLFFLLRRTCHVGAVALGNHTALENLPLPPRL